jgi:hypothetical protein
MKIFLSYAAEDRARAEEIALALRNDGHEVFFDRSRRSGGENYHRVNRGDESIHLDLTPGMIHFRIQGLLPVVRASWNFRPLATAA